MKRYRKYGLDMAKNCCGTKGGDYTTPNGYGSHNHKTGAGYFVYGKSKGYQWKLNYFNNGAVGCLELLNQDRYKKGDSNCYDTVCWDTCNMCSHDLDISKCSDKKTEAVFTSFNKNKRKNLGGGFCTWGDSVCSDPFSGSINVFSGDGSYIFTSKGKKTTYTLENFLVK